MVDFCKYHGLGNDFIVVEAQKAPPTEAMEAMCRRHRGIGADGVLVVRWLDADADGDVQMSVYNRDGSRPEMCGNGLRCVAAHAHRTRGLESPVVVTDAGVRRCRIDDHDIDHWSVTAEMGPVLARPAKSKLEVDGTRYDYLNVDVGNPHAVVFETPDRSVVERVGDRANRDHPHFPEGVNVEFARQREDTGGFETVVFERGVGLTEACGTGACAVAEAVWTTKRRARSESVEVQLPGGVLSIRCDEDGLWMTGEAVLVFCGTWRLQPEKQGDE